MEETLLETWRINCRINFWLIEALTDAQWPLKVDKSKSVAGHCAHIHSVRLMWLKVADPSALEGMPTVSDKSERLETLEAHKLSAAAVERCIAASLESGVRIKGFKPHTPAFVGYLIAHESFHRSQLELTLRQAGAALDDKTAYGLWEWGNFSDERWSEGPRS